jgi:hypothetical protein
MWAVRWAELSGNRLGAPMAFDLVVMSVAGTSTVGSADGSGVSALFNQPMSVFVNSLGSVYVVEYGYHTVRVITSAGVVSTLAGLAGTSGYADGTGTFARFTSPWFVAADSTNTAYITDPSNGALRKVTSSGSVSTVYHDSSNLIWGVAFSTAGVLYASELQNHIISTIDTSGAATRTVFAGSGASGHSDGQGTFATFGSVMAIAFNSVSTLFIADGDNHCIRQITTNGIINIVY